MDLYRVLRPALFRLPAETAHDLALFALRARLVPRAAELPRRPVSLWGLDFANPVGLAAGFDKNAAAVGALLGLGFGFVEIGTVTPRPQPGNPKPRLFRLEADRSLVNRLGFNNAGMEAVARHLEAFRDQHPAAIVGVNAGKNRTSEDAAADYAAVCARLAPFATYLVVNVSSPNTPGLRALQSRDALLRIVDAVRAAMRGHDRPLLVKLAPDLTEDDRDGIAGFAREGAVDGLIVGNTTVSRPASLTSAAKDEAGGLSGAALFDLSTQVLADLHARTGGTVPLIGTGGIASAADARAKLAAGASLVQLYTGMIYEGPGLARRIVAGLG